MAKTAYISDETHHLVEQVKERTRLSGRVILEEAVRAYARRRRIPTTPKPGAGRPPERGGNARGH